jgi:hypothetical protein
MFVDVLMKEHQLYKTCLMCNATSCMERDYSALLIMPSLSLYT